MSTQQITIDTILAALPELNVRARKMFGEYALYCDDKVVALVCDDSLFIKPTAVAHDYLDDTALAPPYPNAKHYYQVSAERLTDHAWLMEFIQRTANELPTPKPKKPKTKPV